MSEFLSEFDFEKAPLIENLNELESKVKQARQEEKERIADFIKIYKERGWDDNRIAARLMISIKQVNEE